MIAPVIVGIAFSSSFGVWKRCAGSFSRSFSRRTRTGCGTALSRSSGKGARQSLLKPSSAASRVGTRKSPARLAPKRISIARLPVTGSDLFGREEDVAFLDDAWTNKDVNVVTFLWFREYLKLFPKMLLHRRLAVSWWAHHAAATLVLLSGFCLREKESPRTVCRTSPRLRVPQRSWAPS